MHHRHSICVALVTAALVPMAMATAGCSGSDPVMLGTDDGALISRHDHNPPGYATGPSGGGTITVSGGGSAPPPASGSAAPAPAPAPGPATVRISCTEPTAGIRPNQREAVTFGFDASGIPVDVTATFVAPSAGQVPVDFHTDPAKAIDPSDPNLATVNGFASFYPGSTPWNVEPAVEPYPGGAARYFYIPTTAPSSATFTVMYLHLYGATGQGGNVQKGLSCTRL